MHMDMKVYRKETVTQPGKDGKDYYVPSVIDLQPFISEEDGVEYITDAALVEDNGEVEQGCVLASIWQRGSDPVDPLVGVRWSEALLGEITAVQVMEDIREAVADVTLNVAVSFNSETTSDGVEVMTYEFKAVA